MHSTYDEMEGGSRLHQVHRIKLFLYLIQLVVILAAVIFLLLVGGGISLKPLYIPVSSFLYFLILMAFVFGVESFFFRSLEIRLTKSVSSKYFMIKNSIKGAFIVIVIAAVVIFLILTPFVSSAIANFASESGETAGVSHFVNRDAMGLTAVNRIDLSTDGHAEVIVIAEDYYLQYTDRIDKLRQYSVVHSYDVAGGVSLEFPSAPFDTYYIVVVGDEVSYHAHRNLSSDFVSFVTLFATLFIVAYVVWVVYLTPFKRKYSYGAIYR